MGKLAKDEDNNGIENEEEPKAPEQKIQYIPFEYAIVEELKTIREELQKVKAIVKSLID